MDIQPIAYFHSPLTSKFGIPKQSGIVDILKGTIVFEKQYRNPDALRGIENFDYLWLIWEFSANKHEATSLMVRPPRLGGNEKVGVFASRSPFRPNSLGLSSVRLKSVEWNSAHGPVLHVLGADLMDGTPIYDIKPYITYADCHQDARSGFVDTHQWTRLEVEMKAEDILRLKSEHAFSDSDIEQLVRVLAEDPRPQYQNNGEKVYGMPFKGTDIHFKVSAGTVHLID